MKLAIVLPCYNEEEVIDESAQKLKNKIDSLISKNVIEKTSFICFIDDGSKDSTWEHIEKLNVENTALFHGIKLSRNRGHQNALLCGLFSIQDSADAVISLDVDLQDDIEAIDEMIEKHKNENCEIVYGVRSDRKEDSAFKRITAQFFYKTLKFLGADIVYNHADFRLMSACSIKALEEYGEVNIFLRGIIPLLGFKTGSVYYARKKREAGQSKYPLSKMLSFALEGATSFSCRPLRMITLLGVAVFFTAIIMIINSVIKHYLSKTIQGWSSTMVSIWFLGGLIILSIGIVGEYIGKIYMETKSRPRYYVEKTI